MKKIILFIISFGAVLYAQNINTENNLMSPQNVKKFADYLFCTNDYLRAVDEYNRYLESSEDDTVEFKIGESYSRMGYYSKAADAFLKIKNTSSFKDISSLYYLRSLFQADDFPAYRSAFEKMKSNTDSLYGNRAAALFNFSYLLGDDTLPSEKKFLKPFSENDKGSVLVFYDRKKNPAYKSPVAAAILSAIIPGAGKFYTEDYADGITAFIATGVLSYIAFTDFKADHQFRAWLFTGLAAGFYAGNIYGAAASAQLFNAKLDFDFTRDVKNFLERVNYFVPVINFCK